MSASQFQGFLSDFLAGLGRLFSGLLWWDGLRTGFVLGALSVLIPVAFALVLRGSRCERG